MANLYNLVGVASTAGGLLSNLLKKPKDKGGTWAAAPKIIAQNIIDYGVQRDNLGLIVCPVPPIMKKRYTNSYTSNFFGISNRSESFNVPGVSIPTSDVRRYGIGPTTRMPIGTVNQSTFTVNFLADQQGVYYQWLMSWLDGVVNFNGRSKGSISTPNSFGASFYEVNYWKDYAVDMDIYELDERFNTIIETKLVGAYPIGISDKNINWNGSGMMSFNVEFAYTATDMKVTNMKIKQPPPGNKPGMLGTLLKGMSIVQAVSSMKGKGGRGNAIGLVAAGAAAISMFK